MVDKDAGRIGRKLAYIHRIREGAQPCDLTTEYGPDDRLIRFAEFDIDCSLEASVAGMRDAACHCLERARSYVDMALEAGPKPSRGFDPHLTWMYWDDESLDYHSAIAYRLAYLVRILSKTDCEDFLGRALMHMKQLLERTDDLSGSISVNRREILCDYLWIGIASGRCSAAIEAAEGHVKPGVNAKTVVKRYRSDTAHLRMLLAVAKFVDGDKTFQSAAERSLRNLIGVHQRFYEPDYFSDCLWCGFMYAFDWAWMWECAFGNPADVEHAMELVSGEAEIGT